MLSEAQITQVWEGLIAAETRALYFADLATRYTRRKQLITGASFFLASGAAATIAAQAPRWVPLLFATVSAIATAYAVAVGLDTKIATFAKLHTTWQQIAGEYEWLWQHTYADGAEADLRAILAREGDPSALALSMGPYQPQLLDVWEGRVLTMRHAGATA
jgi:hypothetical protein